MTELKRSDHKSTDRTDRLAECDDWEVVRLCRDDKEQYFPLLVKRHYELVVNIGYRFFLDRGLAEDVAQEVLITAYNEIDRLQSGKQPFVHWLCRITSNSCRSLYRKRNSEQRAVAAGKVDYWYGDGLPGPEEQNDEETRSAIECVNDALRLLKPDERMALTLAYIAEQKTGEIASIMKSPEYSVRRLLRRSEEKLRKMLLQRKLAEYART